MLGIFCCGRAAFDRLRDDDAYLIAKDDAFAAVFNFNRLCGDIGGLGHDTQPVFGLKVDNVKYIMSQPWPFPSQLMMGLTCQAYDRALTINKKELEDAKWYSKETVAAVFAKQSDAFLRPPRMAVAHHLIRNWLES